MGMMTSKALWLTLMSGSSTAVLSGAGSLLRDETNGLALDFTDSTWLNSTGFNGSAAIKETRVLGDLTTTSTDYLTYTSPSVKMCMGPSGTLRYQAHNIWLNSEAFSTNATSFSTSATDTGNVVSISGLNAFLYNNSTIAMVAGASYSLSVDVTCSATGTVGLRLLDTGSNQIAQSAVSCVAGVTQRVTLTGVAPASANPVFGVEQRSAVITGVSDLTGQTVTLNRIHIRRTPSDSTYLSTTTAARYALPLEWSSTGVLQGLLVEEARTNLALYSQEFDNAAWSAAYTQNCTVTANSAVAPDGTTTADTITVSGGRGLKTQAIVVNNQTVTMSIWMKRKTGTGPIYLYTNNEEAGTYSADLSGQINSSTWSRISHSALTRSGGLGNAYATIEVATSGDEVYVWGAQYEAGSFPTSYIQTFASTVTRVADQITLATTAFPWSNSTSTLYAEGSTQSIAAGRTIASLNDGTASERHWMRLYDAVSGGQLIVTDGGANQSIINPVGATAINTTRKLAQSQQANLFDGAVDGVLGTQDTSGTMPTITTLTIGALVSTEHLNGYVRKVMVLPRSMTNTELQTLTTNGLSSGNLLSSETSGLALDFTDGSFGRYELDYNVTAYDTSPDTTASSLLTYTSPSVKMTMGPSGTLRYQAQNRLFSSNLAGAVAGTPGTAPTNWNYTTSTGAISAVTAGDDNALTLSTSTTRVVLTNNETVSVNTGETFSYKCNVTVNSGAITPAQILTVTTVAATATYTWQGASIGASDAMTGTGVLQANFVFTASGNAGFRLCCGATGNVTANITVSAPHVWRTPADSTYLRTTTNAARYALPLEWSSAGVLQGLLAEEARTNTLTYSNDWSNAAWFKSSTASAVKNATGPDGVASSASTLTFSGAGTFGRSIARGGAAQATASVYVKRTGALSGSVFASYSNATEGPGLITGDDSDFDTIGNWVNRSTGTGSIAIVSGTAQITQVDASNRGQIELALTGLTIGRVYRLGAGFASVSGSPAVSVGFYTGANLTGSLVVSFTAALSAGQNYHFVATATTMYVVIAGAGTGTSFTFSVDNVTMFLTTETDITSSITTDWTRITTTQSGTVQHPAFALRTTAADTFQVSLAQEETGAFATSPIETFASTVTRAADNISLATTAFPSIGSAGTLYVRAASQTVSGTRYALFIGTDGNNFCAIRNDTATSAQGIVFNGGGLVAAPSVINWTGGSFQMVALRAETNNTNICSGGTLGTNDTSCAMPSYTTLRIGGDGANVFNGTISEIMVLPRAMTNAELQTLTT